MISVVAWGQRSGTAPAGQTPVAPLQDDKPVVTKHETTVRGRTLRYSVNTGFLPIRNEAGEAEASMFYMAYTLETSEPAARRPLLFSFNGGPGSASVWLHLGALGPKRVKMMPDGSMPPAPYELVTNEHTWLDQADLVFIDPVGTGYSRAIKPDLARKFNGVRGDIASVGEFIRLYLTRNERWSSPLFLAGESYGTTRAAGLSGYLADRGIAFNGIVLISSILNFQTARFTKGNDLPFVLFLPTYTATAWYHKRLPAELQKDLRATLAEVKLWANGAYAGALAKGDTLSAADRQSIAAALSKYTGLSRIYVENANLRIEIDQFCKELARDKQTIVGRLDTRLTGWDGMNTNQRYEHDPSNSAIRPPYTATFADYVRRELGFKSDLNYYILGGGIAPWDWGAANEGFPDTSDALRAALARNPHMKVFVASGYYDLATPFFATEYTLSHLGIDARVKSNFTTAYYEAGHMMYIHEPSLEKLRNDVRAFITKALAK
ncbi:MAG: peptidase S10 [Candidatus Solibacter usitatus]|nr:peptidase S10 [Candidatus Solibacter usitatus]